MSATQARARRRTLLILAGVAAASVLLGVLVSLPPSGELLRAEVGKRVAPAFETKTQLASLIMVTTKNEAYHLVKNDDGWVLAEKGSYPVTAAKMQELTEALARITYAAPMTRDERKFDRIGLGDPAKGGTAALIEVGDGQGTSFAKLFVGYRDGKTYIRRPDDLQAWEVSGAVMPPLQRGAAFLDLAVVKVDPAEITGADVRPAQGPAYRLDASPLGGFSFAPPYDRRRILAALGPQLTAQAIARFAPLDVAPAGEIAVGVPVAEHITRLNSGIALVVRSWRKGERGWITLSAATAEDASDAAVQRAGEINARAAPWAFALSDLDWGAFSTPLTAMVE